MKVKTACNLLTQRCQFSSLPPGFPVCAHMCVRVCADTFMRSLHVSVSDQILLEYSSCPLCFTVHSDDFLILTAA